MIGVTAEVFMKLTKADDDFPEDFKKIYVRPRAVCADGFSISIQANNAAYCTPRRWDAEKWTDVELGFPVKEEELILEYAEDQENPLESIYTFVPMILVEKVIEKHGGIVSYIDINNCKIVQLKNGCN